MVDREEFKYITNEIKSHENIEIISKEVTKVDLETPTIICAGPLASNNLVNHLLELTGEENLNLDMR